jgi:hypothetical protein
VEAVADDIVHDPANGQLLFSAADAVADKKLAGLFGYGIAFPERTVDPPLGNREEAVGFWKFSRYYLRHVGPTHWPTAAAQMASGEDVPAAGAAAKMEERKKNNQSAKTHLPNNGTIQTGCIYVLDQPSLA